MKPLVLLPADHRYLGGYPMHVLGQKYADAVRDQAQCLPVALPTSGNEDIDAYLQIADGVLLTGSPSNVHPSHFGQDVHNALLPHDTARDSVTLPLIRRCVQLGIPMLAICRGLQEVNVALGGSLHQAVQDVPGRMDHRGAQGRTDASKNEAYAPAHVVSVEPNSHLHRLVSKTELTVNSVHGQGIDRLASGIAVQARAPDGQIEAITINAHRGFNLALQWHPEWCAADNEDSIKIFAAFGDACRAWQNQKHSHAVIASKSDLFNSLIKDSA